MPEISIWEKETYFHTQDVIIIGSGFTGLWSAFHLKMINPHYRITILERGVIPTGASTRNAGFSCFGSPSELLADARSMGKQAMWKLVDRRFRGLQMIRNFFSPQEINYDPSGGYECFIAHDPHWEECSDNIHWLNNELLNITNEEHVFEMADKKLPTFGFHGFAHMIENRIEAGLHPAKLLLALLAKVQQLGVQVLTGIDVKSYEDSDQHVSLQTSQGFTFTAKQLLLCTNAFTADIVPGIDIIPNRGQVLVTNVINNLPFKGTFHFDQGYYYFRNLNNRLLLGGARNASFDTEHTSEMMSTQLIQYRLEKFAREHIIPGVDFTITDRWTGIMAMGNEKWPIVEALSGHVFCCVRMSGMGVALAPLVAQEITTLMHQTSTV